VRTRALDDAPPTKTHTLFEQPVKHLRVYLATSLRLRARAALLVLARGAAVEAECSGLCFTILSPRKRSRRRDVLPRQLKSLGCLGQPSSRVLRQYRHETGKMPVTQHWLHETYRHHSSTSALQPDKAINIVARRERRRRQLIDLPALDKTLLKWPGSHDSQLWVRSTHYVDVSRLRLRDQHTSLGELEHVVRFVRQPAVRANRLETPPGSVNSCYLSCDEECCLAKPGLASSGFA
jgi:hypothetical protein